MSKLLGKKSRYFQWRGGFVICMINDMNFINKIKASIFRYKINSKNNGNFNWHDSNTSYIIVYVAKMKI